LPAKAFLCTEENLFATWVFEIDGIYRTKAARPAMAATPAKAVWRAAPPAEVEVEVAWEPAEEAPLLALETTLLSPDPALEAALERLEMAEEAELATELRPDAAEDSAPARTVETAAPPDEMVEIALPAAPVAEAAALEKTVETAAPPDEMVETASEAAEPTAPPAPARTVETAAPSEEMVEMALEAPASALETAELTGAKTVDSPTAAVEMADPAEEMIDSMVEVEMADATADDAAPATPPAPPAKIVVDPTTAVETAEPSEETTDSMAEVVTADGFINKLADEFEFILRDTYSFSCAGSAGSRVRCGSRLARCGARWESTDTSGSAVGGAVGDDRSSSNDISASSKGAVTDTIGEVWVGAKTGGIS
jgi:hypothetical protein